ncbi:hypothetical protein N7532_002861 [Penicillium argentinense]|uniref:Uncharacterized protein n=1 Tax=Penicillium argentinense TaxID=1131581 RepID=A0A9W9G171_9EURO|nr:uncharacterized protein N7532_002861 [Penicillium argentinense]KAJ5110216.1 hypothetical protein N7532_002861 [Penicillium argentinense]
MAERAPRNESLTDLVRFFQTQNAPLDSTTTALPAVKSPKQPSEQIAKELKPLHRRLLQFTQRQKKEPSSTKSKQDEHQRQIEALQREGYLLPAQSKSKDPKNSLERTSSKTSKASKTSKSSRSSKKPDLKKIGQPWLENKGHSKTSSTDTKSRLASLDLSDFGSMVDVAVSMTEFDDPSPPPYQMPTADGPAVRNDRGVSCQSAPALPIPGSSESRSTSTEAVTYSSTSPVGSNTNVPKNALVRRASSSSSSIVRIVDQETRPTLKNSTSQSTSLHTLDSFDKSVKSEPKPDQSTEQANPAIDTSNISSNGAPSQHSLKLFPDVAPPRMSSKNAWRLSSAPRYQLLSGQAPSIKPNASGEAKDFVKPTEEKAPKAASTSIVPKQETEGPQCSGALVPPACSESTSPDSTESNPSEDIDKSQNKPRPTPSLAMGTLKAFPFRHRRSRFHRFRNRRVLRLLLPISHPSPIAEDPHEPESQELRCATALGFVGEAESVIDDDSAKSLMSIERSHSTSPEQRTPRKRASSVRIPKMQSPNGSDETTPGQPIADSPVLGQMMPTKLHGKRAPRKSLQINSKVDRKNLPFGLPSPPPSGALPPDPSLPTSHERSLAQRNITAPSGPSSRALEAAFGSSHRSSMISRSNSSRSSLRHESIPEFYEASRSESPLPSSDDEGFGPSADTVRTRRVAEKQPKRAQPVRHKYETVDGRTGYARPRYPHPMRSLTPQGRSNYHDADKIESPNSLYSQPSYPSRDPQSSSHRIQLEPNPFLEDRIANLERQNQILQAALLAALNAGVKNSGMDDLQAALSPPFSAAPPRPYQRPQHLHPRYTSRPDSWVSSSRSSEHSGFETPGSVRDSRANIRQLDNMIEDIEAGWLSDKSSLSGPRMARKR